MPNSLHRERACLCLCLAFVASSCPTASRLFKLHAPTRRITRMHANAATRCTQIHLHAFLIAHALHSRRCGHLSSVCAAAADAARPAIRSSWGRLQPAIAADRRRARRATRTHRHLHAGRARRGGSDERHSQRPRRTHTEVSDSRLRACMCAVSSVASLPVCPLSVIGAVRCGAAAAADRQPTRSVHDFGCEVLTTTA